MLAVAAAMHTDTQITGLTYNATGAGGNVFVEFEPSTPDLAVTWFTRPGTPELSFAIPAADPGLQVIVRGAKQKTTESYALAMQVLSTFDHLDGMVLAEGTDHEVYVIGCTAAQSAPIPLGRDSNDRPRWSLNFLLSINQPTAHRP